MALEKEIRLNVVAKAPLPQIVHAQEQAKQLQAILNKSD